MTRLGSPLGHRWASVLARLEAISRSSAIGPAHQARLADIVEELHYLRRDSLRAEPEETTLVR